MARRGTAKLLGAVLAAGILLMGAPAAQARDAARKVPFGFVGMNADGALFEEPTVDVPGEVDAMAGAGVESLRVVVDWRSAQPYVNWDAVPADERGRYRDEGGVPTDYSVIDSIVGLAAARGVRVLPVVMIAPQWAGRPPFEFRAPPRAAAPYARFVAALSRRYGPNGTYWQEQPQLQPIPIRDWQVWNEPSLREFWRDRPWEKDYVKLLRATRQQVKVVDRGARIILAGFPNKSWIALESAYRAGARRYFDAAALHPFTLRVGGVLDIIARGRAVMRKYGDARKPLLVTELGWPSAKGKTEWTYGIEVTEAQQAARVRSALPAVAARRRSLRIEAAYWYTWLTLDRHKRYPFDYAGVSRVGEDGKVVRKPAFGALRDTALGLEGCATKPSGARSCGP